MPPQTVKKTPRPTAAPPRNKAANNNPTRPGRIKRFFPPRPALDYDHSEFLQDEEELVAEEPPVPDPVEEPELELIARIHDKSLSCLRTIKASIEFGRAAGQALAEARDIVGKGNFDNWVEKSLAISPAEAHALLAFSRESEVRRADVSPANAMTLKTSLGLLSRLCDQFGEQAGKVSASKRGCTR